MGLFRIADSDVYVSYRYTDDEVTIYTYDFKEKTFYLKISNESSSIQKWARNLQQTPDKYMQQLVAALKEQSFKKDDSSNPEKLENSIEQNIFELDETNNLIWKQYFPSKNIFGRKGKFSLEEKPKDEVLKVVLNTASDELNEKETEIVQQNSKIEDLMKEKTELRLVAEESVAMKERFEEEIYAKFALLLNAKKKENEELRLQLHRSDSRDNQDDPLPPGDAVLAEDEYEVDTDVDSPDEEVKIVGQRVPNPAPALSKRGGEVSMTKDGNKKLKGDSQRHSKRDSQKDFDSQDDLLNDSLESDLKCVSSQNFRPRF